MNGVFGRGDWVANGLLFAGYHLHVPWAIPGTLLEMFTTAYLDSGIGAPGSGSRYSAQSVFLGTSSSRSSSEKRTAPLTSKAP